MKKYIVIRLRDKAIIKETNSLRVAEEVSEKLWYIDAEKCAVYERSI
jgi:hypothetical protein